MSTNHLQSLIKELCAQSTEEAWLEFKKDNYRPDMIGEDISALANSAALFEHDNAYMVWGVDNDTHEIVGTTYDFQSLKKGNEELESWLRHQLTPNADFKSEVVEIERKRVCVLTIRKALSFPVAFENVKYIRIGSYTKKLQDYPQKEASLWERLRNIHFEDEVALENQSMQDIVRLLSISTYFDKLGLPQPTDIKETIRYLLEDRILLQQDNGQYSITNLGALLFAKQLRDFPTVSYKALRVIQYKGDGKVDMLKDNLCPEGYAMSFEKQLSFVEALLPSSQPIVGAYRVEKQEYPSVAIREILANAILHQDLTEKGASPLVELFDHRIEITNPGRCLVEIDHLIDSPPKTRNESLAALGRRMHFCEEAGTGWDKVVLAIEQKQLPAPKMELYENFTRVTLYGEIPFKDLSMNERVYACYMHSCIQYMQGKAMTNQSLRERFGLPISAQSQVSRLIKRALQQGKIKIKDSTESPRYFKYIPVWG